MTAKCFASRPPRANRKRNRRASAASSDSIASAHAFGAAANAPAPSPPKERDVSPRSLPSFAAYLLGLHESSADSQQTDIEHAWTVATKRRGVYNLFQVPARLERLLTLGHFICVDEFLTLFTILPLRVFLALLQVLWVVLLAPFNACFRRNARKKVCTQRRIAATVDVLHASLLVLTASALYALDISWIYHNIRGQSVIKLYVVFNVIEIFDRLCSSFGVDILDSLGWTTASAVTFFSRDSSSVLAEKRRRAARAHAVRGFALLTRMAFDYLFTLIYLVLHAFLLMTWVVTLNVAINTQNNALLTLLVSNNFVELKGSVFKNFKVQNLFQISCSDAVERFQLNVFLAIMIIVTSGDARLFSTWGVIFACEVSVDWVKHAFVTKFNRISHRAYYQFSVVICDDMVKTKKHSVVRSIGGSAVAKRIGFVSLPLSALVIRMVLAPVATLPMPALVMLFLCLLFFKIALSIGLLGYAHRKLKGVANSTAPEDRDVSEETDSDLYWHQKLINIERYNAISKS